MIQPYYKSKDFTLLQGDCCELLESFDFQFDAVFADPPYFLSNNGLSYQNGKIVSVNKGQWDRSLGEQEEYNFTYKWLSLCKDKLKPQGTIWVTGTYHNIFTIARCLKELNYKILNIITWKKTNPPPNFSCRVFQFSTEFIIWARKEPSIPHLFNYEVMKHMNNGKQMSDLWVIPAVQKWEKSCGKHPTQKPLQLLARIISASTPENGWVLDPFSGSGTTGIAANLLGRKYLGIEQQLDYLLLSTLRRNEITDTQIFQSYVQRLNIGYSKKHFE